MSGTCIPRSELDLLIAEQEHDARTGDRVHSLSLDAFPSGADITLIRPRVLANDPRHGTINCYTNLRCRCAKCRAAQAEAKRDWRRRRRPRVKKRSYGYRMCCLECGSDNVKRVAYERSTAA